MPAQRWITLGLLTAGYCLALFYGQTSLPVVVTFGLLIMAGICVTQFSHWAVRTIGHFLFIAIALALASHWMPGFLSARVIAAVRFSPEAAPYSMFLNLDKPLIGFWVVLACPWVFARITLNRTALTIALTLPLTIALCVVLSTSMGIVGWTPKWPVQAGIWMFNNLLLVTLVEELVFRGYLQGGLTRLLRRVPFHQTLALIIASLLFGLTHLGTGWQWAVVAAIAALGYGVAYRYGGLWAAVITHFGVNLTHFALFTYPLFNR